MNILIDELPTTVMIDGRKYPVNWGFRTFILIEICIFDQKLSDNERVSNALLLFYGDEIPDDGSLAFEKMMWFYRGGKAEKKDQPSKGRGASGVKRCYCFEQDAPYIYSAFRTQYKIDLQDLRSEELHWWKFKAMFESLDDNLKISKIMGYRAAKTTGMGKEQKALYTEMKKLYALDVEETADLKMKLAKRDADMKSFIKRRTKEAQHANES